LLNPHSIAISGNSLYNVAKKANQVAQVCQSLAATGGKGSRFLGDTKTQLASVKTSTLTDIPIVVFVYSIL
jgi:hypothetical protein